jgi:hypothetical protein
MFWLPALLLLELGSFASSASAQVPSCPSGAGIVHASSTDKMVICNTHYRAVLSTVSGELLNVSRRDPSTGNATVTRDRLLVRMTGQGSSVDLGTLTANFVIDDDFDFYVRVRAWPSFTDNNRKLVVERSYEFTESPHIYEHLRVRVTEGPYTGGYSPLSVPIDRFEWLFDAANAGVWVTRSASDMFMDNPDGPYGGRRMVGAVRWSRAFTRMPTNVTQAPSSYGRLLVNGGKFVGTNVDAVILPGTSYLAGAVITVGTTNQDWPFIALQGVIDHEEFQFYPSLGLWRASTGPPACHVHSWGAGTFGNPNQQTMMYQLIPASSQQTSYAQVRRDYLIRESMHMRWRLATDNGWPRLETVRCAGVDYPDGYHSTPNSRAFPPVLYTWAMLTWRHSTGQWQHVPSQADVLLDALQGTRPFYTLRAGPNFEDSYRATPYLAWAAERKAILPGPSEKGVLNAHAHALHFAWLMAEANAKAGRATEAADWWALVLKYHQGSLRLFSDAYPAQKGGLMYWGIVQYAPGSSKMEPDYNTISFEGISAGYLAAHDSQYAFAEAVERGARLDYDPSTSAFDRPHPATRAFIARLCRVFPPAIAFSGDSLQMSQTVSAASLEEVLTYGAALDDPALAASIIRTHDPQRVIVDPKGDHYIYTNRLFVSQWLDGFWQEVDLASVPDQARFYVEVRPVVQQPALNGPRGPLTRFLPPNYSIVRRGSLFEFMADDRASVILYVAHQSGGWVSDATSSVNVYQNHRWSVPTNAQTLHSQGAPAGYYRFDLGEVAARSVLNVRLIWSRNPTPSVLPGAHDSESH